MAKKSGLGKGIEAIFTNTEILKEIQSKTDEKKEEVKYIKLTDIEPNETQARKKFNEEKLEELATSIKHYGVIQPIIVENMGDYYRIIAGERRWRASKIAGIEEIPCLVRKQDEQMNKEISLIENIQRENLNPIEKAYGYRELIDNYNLRQQDLADKLGISRTYVANTLRILNLDPRVMKLALDGHLTESHCKILLQIEDGDKQLEMANLIIEKGGTVSDLERMIKNKKRLPKKNKEYEKIYRDIEDSFESFFGTKVKMNAGKRSGRIVIHYTSNDDLERILEIIRKEK